MNILSDTGEIVHKHTKFQRIKFLEDKFVNSQIVICYHYIEWKFEHSRDDLLETLTNFLYYKCWAMSNKNE